MTIGSVTHNDNSSNSLRRLIKIEILLGNLPAPVIWRPLEATQVTNRKSRKARLVAASRWITLSRSLSRLSNPDLKVLEFPVTSRIPTRV